MLIRVQVSHIGSRYSRYAHPQREVVMRINDVCVVRSLSVLHVDVKALAKYLLIPRCYAICLASPSANQGFRQFANGATAETDQACGVICEQLLFNQSLRSRSIALSRGR